ncbi:MAG: efflux RND transporter periplasmic adaptor subunit [Verrucomicrobiales bacterium]|nr:efflux RND transporter periplasmic adaptor subunit [Verrucomicrobiota bacterium JB025]
MLSRILAPLLILVLGFGAWKWLGIPVEEPKPTRHERKRLKTEKEIINISDYPVILKTQGSVRAHHQTTLTPLVSGTISKIHPRFEDGAFFNEGDVLAELDPADLTAALTAAESALARAEASLAREEALAKQAQLNWDDLGYEEKPSPLVLRIPQLKEANAAVTSAQANLEQAQRNLERTKIRAPFDGRVKTRIVGLGQAVGATTPLGEVFASDLAEIRLPLSAGQLRFVKLPSREGDSPVPVELTDAIDEKDGPAKNTWKATIVRTEGELDERSRELFAIARIEDPFGLKSGNPELRIGQPVRADVQGIVLKDVFAIPRNAVRGLNTIYLIDQEELRLRRTEVAPVWTTPDTLVIRDGLEQGEWLATSNLPWAPNGAPVQIIEPIQAIEAGGLITGSAPENEES